MAKKLGNKGEQPRHPEITLDDLEDCWAAILPILSDDLHAERSRYILNASVTLLAIVFRHCMSLGRREKGGRMWVASPECTPACLT